MRERKGVIQIITCDARPTPANDRNARPRDDLLYLFLFEYDTRHSTPDTPGLHGCRTHPTPSASSQAPSHAPGHDVLRSNQVAEYIEIYIIYSSKHTLNQYITTMQFAIDIYIYVCVYMTLNNESISIIVTQNINAVEQILEYVY